MIPFILLSTPPFPAFAPVLRSFHSSTHHFLHSLYSSIHIHFLPVVTFIHSFLYSFHSIFLSPFSLFHYFTNPVLSFILSCPPFISFPSSLQLFLSFLSANSFLHNVLSLFLFFLFSIKSLPLFLHFLVMAVPRHLFNYKVLRSVCFFFILFHSLISAFPSLLSVIYNLNY
jgi:hypothetical protein